MDIYLKRKKISLNPTQAIGKGGEADVYDIGNSQAAKIFKQPNHPDYQGCPTEQQAAKIRLEEHQQKLPAFPQNLPSRVIYPQELVTDKAGKKILGYTMPLLKNAEVLLKYSERNFRLSGISNQIVVSIFKDLHQTVKNLHASGIIIGDFNDLNVLVNHTEAYLIDADSFQFSGYFCRVFTAKFVDPLLCDPAASRLILQQPHSTHSDWYAFAVMLMQCLLFVDPYGGVYKPKAPQPQIPHAARALHRITVFNPDVKYPKPAIPYQVLSDDLLQHFYQCFEKDARGEFPLKILDHLHWKTCQSCGMEHTRQTCPNCTQLIPINLLQAAMITQSVIVKGTITATRVFTTEGIILFATCQNQKLHWIYHENREFKREDDAIIFTGELEPNLHFGIQGKTTLIGKQGLMICLPANQSPNRIAADTFDANHLTYYWIDQGQLLRQGNLGSEYMGDVLPRQTRFWVGSQFGFGFYRAGNLSVAFVFDAKKSGIKDQVQFPNFSGQIIDATCTFSDSHCWFLWSTQEQEKTVNHCAIIHPDATIEAVIHIEASDHSWLSQIRGHCAISNFLLAATDEGIVRIETRQGKIFQTKEFPDTEPFVNANSQLFASQQGIYIVNPHDIQLLKIT